MNDEVKQAESPNPSIRIRDDGTIEGHYVETHYHECDGFYIDRKNPHRKRGPR